MSQHVLIKSVPRLATSSARLLLEWMCSAESTALSECSGPAWHVALKLRGFRSTNGGFPKSGFPQSKTSHWGTNDFVDVESLMILDRPTSLVTLPHFVCESPSSLAWFGRKSDGNQELSHPNLSELPAKFEPIRSGISLGCLNLCAKKVYQYITSKLSIVMENGPLTIIKNGGLWRPAAPHWLQPAQLFAGKGDWIGSWVVKSVGCSLSIPGTRNGMNLIRSYKLRFQNRCSPFSFMASILLQIGPLVHWCEMLPLGHFFLNDSKPPHSYHTLWY